MNSKNKKTVKKLEHKTSRLKLPPIDTSIENETVKTIIDVDPDYFSLVDKRPIKPNNSINTYRQNIRDVALKRSVRGFLTDEILRINKEIATEINIFETASKHFNECKESFDKFLAYDNDKTICVMKKSDALNKELMNKTEDYKKINHEMASMKSKLQYIDETLSILLSFENFLHKISPDLWIKSQNLDLTKKHSEIFSVNSDIFQKVDINVIIDRLNDLPSPRIYFKSPEQLQNIFYLLEKQNLNCLLISEEMNSLKNIFVKTRRKFEKNLKQEMKLIEEKICEIDDIIQCHQVKETDLKEMFYKILNEKIRHLVSSEDALKIYTNVEYVYEQLIAPNDTKQNLLEMTLALESEYNNLMLDLSVFDINVVNQIEKETFTKNTKELKKAKEADNLLKNVDKISKRLKTAYVSSLKQTH